MEEYGTGLPVHFLAVAGAVLRKAGVDQSVTMKFTIHKTADRFQHNNMVDNADVREAYRKLEGFLGQEMGEGSPGKLGSGQKVLP